MCDALEFLAGAIGGLALLMFLGRVVVPALVWLSYRIWPKPPGGGHG